MQPTRPGSIAQWRFERWPWAAGVGAGVLLLWIGSCALCSDSGDLARPPPLSAQPSDRPTSDADAEIDALRMALDREVEAREQLAREVASLHARIDSTDRAPSASSPGAAPDRDAQRSRFDGSSLIAAGMAAADVQDLRSRWESTELEKIRLIDRATREGWLGTAQYQQQMQSLEGDLRKELSEPDYDRYLYATGRNNRARITDVLANSPGEAAGFRPGDTILSYDGKRVFSIEELRDLATRSRPGDTIRVEVLQHGRVETLYVPAGPIGLMLQPEHQAPR
jgi:PDZ domain